MTQEKHHKTKSFKEEYMKMLTAFDVAYKDKYLFEFYEWWTKISPCWGLALNNIEHVTKMSALRASKIAYILHKTQQQIAPQNINYN